MRDSPEVGAEFATAVALAAMSLLTARLRRAIRELMQAGLDAVCPSVCPGCGVDGEGLCFGCARRLEWRRPPVCARCGAPVIARGVKCTNDHRRIQGLLLVRAPFRYRGTGGDLVRRAKFQADRAALTYLARAMADSLSEFAGSAGRRAVLVSVPLHPGKRRARGLDQAALLADEVARSLHLAHAPGALRRVRDTLPQGDIRVTSRLENVRDAFAARRPRKVRDRIVVLVDDVRTSGSTALECARVLRSAGARQVVLLTAAQA